MKTRVLFGLFLMILISCAKEENNPSDEFTLKSSQYTGFLFEDLQIISFPNTDNLKPDFIVSAQTVENGTVVSPFLSHPALENRFFLSDNFENYENALACYNNFTIPKNVQLEQFALNIKPNQIWLIKTNTENFGVILIKSAAFNNNNYTPYAETTFKAKIIN